MKEVYVISYFNGEQGEDCGPQFIASTMEKALALVQEDIKIDYDDMGSEVDKGFFDTKVYCDNGDIYTIQEFPVDSL